MNRYLAVAAGGALGAITRYWIGCYIPRVFPSRFPFATLIINISGCFVLGLFLTLVTERIRIDPMWTLAISTGFVGSYTTFSTFEFESFKLIEAGSSFSALGNISISLILGFVAVWGGVALAHRIDNRRAVRSPAPHSRPAVTVNAEVEEVLADESF